MTHLVALLFAYAGFTALGASMNKHQVQMLGRRLEPREQRYGRLGGGLALAGAYAAAVAASGWKVGAVEWVGTIILAALTLALLLPYRARLAAQAGAGAAIFGGMLAASAIVLAATV